MANTPPGFPNEITPGNRWTSWGGFSALFTAPSIVFPTDATTRYFPLLDTTSGTRPFKIRMYKSTDAGATWTEMDSAGAVTIGQNTSGSTDTTNAATTSLTSFVYFHEVFNACFDETNGIIYVVYFSASNTLTAVAYDTLADAWGTPVDSGIDPKISTAFNAGLLVGRRPSDGAIWIVTQSATNNSITSVGTNALAQSLTQQPVLKAIKYQPGVGWGSLSIFAGASGTGFNYQTFGIGVESSGRIQILGQKLRNGANAVISFDVDTTTSPGNGFVINHTVSDVGNDAGYPDHIAPNFFTGNWNVVASNNSTVQVGGDVEYTSGAISNTPVNPGTHRALVSFPTPWYSFVTRIIGEATIFSQCINTDDSFGTEVDIDSGDNNTSTGGAVQPVFGDFLRPSNIRPISGNLWAAYTKHNILTSDEINFITAAEAASPGWGITAPTVFNPPYASNDFPFVDFADVSGSPVAFVNGFDPTFSFVNYGYSVFDGSSWPAITVFATDDESSEFINVEQLQCVAIPSAGVVAVTFIYGTHFVSVPGTAFSYLVGQAYWETPLVVASAVRSYAQYIKRLNAPGH